MVSSLHVNPNEPTTAQYWVGGVRATQARIVRSDATERHAHEAAAYDIWLKAKISASLSGIADDTNPIIPDEEWTTERAQWLREAA